ncbi:eukaryotic translation initiation factor 4 gamma 2 [Aethina tumida]|uniref:eukaryotic translation initiation factor 4 gamma 2 n=1 Tax=Aethina tumida TaxID=116153 RepID=UPI00096AE74F|nr:eukaryotic translation initiation factor 4 gamma 2 [Aethina tumida]
MYAQLCKRLTEEAPNFEPEGKPCTFRVLLLNKCKLEFENRAKALEQASHGALSGENLTEEEEEERRYLAKRKMLGNIKFIGELGKLEILSENILHICIQELLVVRRGRDGGGGDDPSEDLECLCQIMRTCGRILDSDKGRKLMEQYFGRMRVLAENHELPARIRFMLKDVIDLRQDGWIPRKAALVEGPVPINQIRPPEDDRPPQYRRDRNNERDLDRSSAMSELFRHPMKTRSGFDDQFSIINLAPPSNLIAPPPFSSSTNGYGGGGGNPRDGSYRGHNNQRSGGGYNSYNNQRGQYNRNMQNNSQYNNQSNKDLAPRFKKSLIVSKEEMSEMELRPTTMLFNKASVKSNNMVNSNRGPMSTGPAATIDPPPPSMLTHNNVKQSSSLVKEPLPIKQIPADRPKQSKKDKGPSKEEILKKFNTLLEEYWRGDIDLKQAINAYKEHKIPEKFAKDLILSGLTTALEKSDVEQEKLIKYLSNLKEENAVNGHSVQEAFKSLCSVLEQRGTGESAKATSSASVLLAMAVAEHLVLLADVAVLTENGTHYPLFLSVLQYIHKKRGRSELSELFNKSKVNLLTQLPENDRTKERLSEILEERELTFLYPLLRIQADLLKQLQADPNPSTFYKWIKENLDASSFTDPGFINALMTVLLKYITNEAAASNGDEKQVTEKEKSMLVRYQPILHAFLRDRPSLQLVAVYSLQVHFYALGFPRGQLLRWFMALYDLEIVDEEAFLNWKEDVTDAYPGKGQALFQVNTWLTWLQEAESEEEEGDD